MSLIAELFCSNANSHGVHTVWCGPLYEQYYDWIDPIDFGVINSFIIKKK